MVVKEMMVGQPNIQQAYDNMKVFIENCIKGISEVYESIKPIIINIWEAIKKQNDSAHQKYYKRVVNRQKLYEKKRRMGRRL